MNQQELMMQVPFKKIGQIGKIDWFETGNFAQFQDSHWMDDKWALKRTIETEILKLRQNLCLKKEYTKMVCVLFILVLAMSLVWIVVVIAIVLNNRNNKDAEYHDKIMIFGGVCSEVFVAVCMICRLKKVLKMIRSELKKLNQKIQEEGINVQIVFKNETFLQKYIGDMQSLKMVQVFEYINQ